MLVRAAVFLLLLIAAISAGIYLGGRGASSSLKDSDAVADQEPEPDAPESSQPDAPEEPEEAPAAPFAPPLYYYADFRQPADDASAREVVTMARDAGVSTFIVPVDLNWQDGGGIDLSPLAAINEIAPDASCIAHVNLNPPSAWLSENPEAQVRTGDGPRPFASPDASAWRDDATAALTRLVSAVLEDNETYNVTGYMVSALEEGYWYLRQGDRSPATESGFRQWIVDRYETNEVLQAAWGGDEASLESAPLPEKAGDESAAVFCEIPDQQAMVDYGKYLSERTARAIAHFAATIKDATENNADVIVPYGFLFELPSALGGHAALERVLASRVDAIASPVSLSSRSIGGTGGYMGPVNTAKHAFKDWLILDDTRTGIADGNRGPGAGVPMADIYNVLERNFASALSHGLGLAWCDFEGQVQHNDPTMWTVFNSFQQIYRDALAHQQALAGQYRIYDVRPEGMTDLAVVIDEESTFYTNRGGELNEKTLRDVRDAALKAGVPVQFVLLSDVLADKAPPAKVYLFANLWKLSAMDREHLHAILTRERATAVWLYAPGYFDETGSADNISATTKMTVRAFEEPTVSGSTYALNGSWIRQGESLGEPVEWSPLFYIEPEEAGDEEDERFSAFAHYGSEEEGNVSIASYYTDEDWTSIYLAEPNVTPRLLREILRMLEITIFASTENRAFADTYYFTNNLLTIHAETTGERTIPFAHDYDVLEALQAVQADLGMINVSDVMGWTGKRSITVPMDMGETHMFRLTPIVPNAQ